MYYADVERILGADLYRKLISVGYFDRMEVSNSSESVGYIASPNDFQKSGRPFEDDPIDDAKALLASLTYGRTRREYSRRSEERRVGKERVSTRRYRGAPDT